MMKQYKNYLLGSLALGLSLVACSQAELDHPFNPSSEEYIGDEYAFDHDGNGVADLIDLYQDQCGTDLNCALNAAIADSVIILPSSSVAVSSSSSVEGSSSVNQSSSEGQSSESVSSSSIVIPTYTVEVVNGSIVGLEGNTGEFAANQKINLLADGISGFDLCFDGWTITEGKATDLQSSTLEYRLPITPSGEKIILTAQTSDCVGYFTDARDGKKYEYIEVGLDTWIKGNLNYAIAGSYCYGNDEANCDLYGRMYDYATATGSSSNTSDAGDQTGTQGICPAGWHLPTKAEMLEVSASDSLLTGGYGKINGSASFSAMGQYGRYWTSDVGKADLDNGTPRNFCDYKDSNPDACATGFAHNINGGEGWTFYAAEENKSNLFNVRCKLD